MAASVEQGPAAAEFIVPDRELALEVAKSRGRSDLDPRGRGGRTQRAEGARGIRLQRALQFGELEDVPPRPTGQLLWIQNGHRL